MSLEGGNELTNMCGNLNYIIIVNNLFEKVLLKEELVANYYLISYLFSRDSQFLN